MPARPPVPATDTHKGRTQTAVFRFTRPLPRGSAFTEASLEVRRRVVVARNPPSHTRGMRRDDVMAVVNLRASMVAAQREYDELELSDNVTPSGEVLPLTAHEEFVIRRYAAISLMYHQAVHRYYGLPCGCRLPDHR